MAAERRRGRTACSFVWWVALEFQFLCHRRRGVEITPFNLMLATGNNYGLGSIRKIEMQGSCFALGIWAGHCDVLDVPELQDDPKVWWPREKIRHIVEQYVKKWKIDVVSSPAWTVSDCLF